LEYLDVDERLILKQIFKKWEAEVDWIAVAQDRDSWRAVVNAANEPSGSKKCGEFLDQLRNC